MSYWYRDNTNGIVVSSRIRLARNLTDFPFPRWMSPEMFEELKSKIKSVINAVAKDLDLDLKFIEMDNIPHNEITAMVERHIISREFAENYKGRAIAISSDESVSIMIGEEDHIRIQVLGCGLSIENNYYLADKIDTALGEKLNFAYDSELGYLTECPTNIGTGLRASVMLHLPLHESSGAIQSITEAVGKIGLTVRGMYGEGSNSKASLYQISNQITLGISEKSAVENLKVIAGQIVEREENLRNRIERTTLEDSIFRAVGILKYARKIDSNEFMQLISRIKLGIDMGIIGNGDINPIEMLVSVQPGMLQSKYGSMEASERDELRAKITRENINNKL